MSATENEGYYSWLVRETGAPSTRNLARTYWSLLSQLHSTPFRWYVPNDDNRNEDGKALRDEFLDLYDINETDEQWLDVDASMLEVLIALSRRAAFESSGSPSEWFWKFIENLGLRGYSDAVYTPRAAHEVDDVIEQLLTRQYNRNGEGGLFPLRGPGPDQRRIEIWYQMSTYLLERNAVANGPQN